MIINRNEIKTLLLFVLLATCATGYSQIRDKDSMIKAIFNALKNKDEDGFVKLFPDAATMKSFMQTLINADSTGKMEAMMEEYADEMSDSSFQKNLHKDFKRSIKKGEDKGIDWPRTELVSFTADTTKVNEDGIKTSALEGSIYFRFEAKDYFIRYNEVIWFDNKGWYGVSIKRIDEKGKEKESEANDWNVDDSTASPSGTVIVGDDSISPPIKGTPVQKSKPAVRNKPVKSKTPTPARKP